MNYLTLNELILKLQNIQNQRPDLSESPVFIIENTIHQNTITPVITQLRDDFVTIEDDLSSAVLFTESQFNNGVVIGYIPIVE